MSDPKLAQTGLNMSLVQREFPRIHETNYLNTGSSGRKPVSVLAAVADGWNRLNDNPTFTTFLDPQPMAEARSVIAGLLSVPATSVLLVQNPTLALQLLMQSFLLKAGDELVTTTHEHGALYTVARHLEETRGVVVRRFDVDPEAGSDAFCLGLLDLVGERTKLVALSEISCTSGWYPRLYMLAESLRMLEVPFLVDGAHTSGHVISDMSRYPMWVGSGHKWLGGPNGASFAYVAPDLIPLLKPVWLGDKYFERLDANVDDLTRFESQGTSDVVKWLGLTRACRLYAELGPQAIVNHQNHLVDYLHHSLNKKLRPTYRTPLDDLERRTALVTFNFPLERVKVPDISECLFNQSRIFVRNDFVSKTPHLGIRVSCHYSVTESDLDALTDALSTMVEPA